MRGNHRDRFKTTLFFIIVLSSLGNVMAQQGIPFINHMKIDLNINSKYFIKVPWDKGLLTKETSMSANATSEKLAYEHYKNANKATISPTSTIRRDKGGRGVGTKFQEGGEINYDRGRQNIANRRAAKEAAKQQEVEQNPKGQKFQYGGDINIRFKENRAREKAEQEAAKQQELQTQAEQLKVNILTYGTIGLVSLFFVIATTTFCILYTGRNKNNSHTSNY